MSVVYIGIDVYCRMVKLEMVLLLKNAIVFILVFASSVMYLLS